MTFEEMADILGSAIDHIDLGVRLQNLVDKGILRVCMTDDDVRAWSLVKKEETASN